VKVTGINGPFLLIAHSQEHANEVVDPLESYRALHYSDTPLFWHSVRGNDQRYNPGETVLVVGVSGAAQALGAFWSEFIKKTFTTDNPDYMENHPLGVDPDFQAAYQTLKAKTIARGKTPPSAPSVTQLHQFFQGFNQLAANMMLHKSQYFPLPETPGKRLLWLYQQLFPCNDSVLTSEDVLEAMTQKRLDLREGAISNTRLFHGND
jgi:hypothetical protein